MLIWKGPALAIAIGNLIIFEGILGYGILHLLFEMDQSAALAIGLLVTSLGSIVCDLIFRDEQGLKLFELSASTFMFVLPTWTVGLMFAIYSVGEIYRSFSGIDAAPGILNEAGESPKVEQIAVGGSYSCAVLEGGRVACWGWSNENQDHAYAHPGLYYRPNIVPGLSGVTKLALGPRGSEGINLCSLNAKKELSCWGPNDSGKLGLDPESTAKSTKPIVISGLKEVEDVSIGQAHICALLASKSVACWGENSFRQLGERDVKESWQPSLVLGIGDVQKIEAGYTHTCALHSDQTVWCWGSNSEGRLGTQSRTGHARPTQVPDLEGVIDLVLGEEHSCALMADKTVKCWGNNNYGRLGDPEDGHSHKPQTVPGLREVVSIAAGENHSCALIKDGTVFCWGQERAFVRSERDSDKYLGPTEISGLADVISLSIYEHNCALLKDHTVRCWGNNSFGQLGLGHSEMTDRMIEPAGL